MPAREQSRLAVISVGASTCLLLCALLGLEGVVAYALPMVALLVPLLAGRYPGEEILVRAIRAKRARLRPRREPRLRLPRAPALAVRGSLLIGAARAIRPPPAVSSV